MGSLEDIQTPHLHNKSCHLLDDNGIPSCRQQCEREPEDWITHRNCTSSVLHRFGISWFLTKLNATRKGHRFSSYPEIVCPIWTKVNRIFINRIQNLPIFLPQVITHQAGKFSIETLEWFTSRTKLVLHNCSYSNVEQQIDTS